jgi:Holliday junction resolvase RusA-like endonuclease
MVIVEGTIKGKARPRVFGKHAVTPTDTVNYENWVRICYQQQDGRMIEGPIRAVINVYHKVPKSYSKKKIQAIKDGLEFPQKKPDSDNIAKIILDSLNKIAYDDDKQIVYLEVNKRWTEELERIEFELSEIFK